MISLFGRLSGKLNNILKSRHRSGYIIKKVSALVLLLAVLFQCVILPDKVNAAVTSNLSVIIYSPTSISLNWYDLLTNEKYYVVEKKEDQGAFQAFSTLYTNSVTQYDGTVTAGHTYTYRIRVTDADNNTYLYTQELTFRTDEIEKPNSLTVTPVSDNQIDIKWGYPNNKAYNTIIERRMENDTVWAPIANVGMGQNAYSDKTIISGYRYYYRVRACSNDNVKTTAYPEEGSSAYSLLLKPTDLYGYALSQRDIQITWKDNSNETAFILERRSPKEGIFREVAVIPQNNNAYIDRNVDENTMYAYRLRAVSGTTSSEYSDVIYITSTYLKPPGSLSSSCADGTSIKLLWQDLTDNETGFEIWRKTGSGQKWELYDSMGRNATTYTDMNISLQDTYTYKIRARINNNSVYSDFSNETTVWSTTIPAPADLKYEVVGTNEIRLTWKDTSMVEAGYRLERKIGLSGEWYTIAYLDPNTVSYNDKWINSTDIYFYRVKVFDRSNSINYSNELMVFLKKPEAPTNLLAKTISSSEILLEWKDNSLNENAFIIEAMQFYNFREVGRVNSNVTSFTYKNISPDKTLTFRVRAVNGTNQSDASNEVVATTAKNITYSDLGNYVWAVEAINNLSSRGVFDEKSGQKFYPEKAVTKAEFCAFVIRGLGLNKAAAGSFGDVNSKSKYYKELMTAAKLGIISPDKNNKLYPNSLITREQAGVIISLALKAKGKPLPEANVNVLKQFTDFKSISASSAEKITAVFNSGILTGKTINNKLYLQLSGSVNRAEAAVMVYKALNLT